MRIRAWLAGILLVAICCLYLTRTFWFEAMGRFLVETQPPEKADMIVVLGGDWYGNRILKAAELVKQIRARRQPIKKVIRLNAAR